MASGRLKEFAAPDKSLQKRINAVLQDTQSLFARYSRGGTILRLRKLRIGDFRLLCGIFPQNEVLLVLLVEHRSRAYSRRSRTALARRAPPGDQLRSQCAKS